jgi:hypothetical protein
MTMQVLASRLAPAWQHEEASREHSRSTIGVEHLHIPCSRAIRPGTAALLGISRRGQDVRIRQRRPGRRVLGSRDGRGDVGDPPLPSLAPTVFLLASAS